MFIAAAWTVPEGHVLLDGMHRACALYRVAPPVLDVSVIDMTPPPGCADTQPGPRDRVLR